MLKVLQQMSTQLFFYCYNYH